MPGEGQTQGTIDWRVTPAVGPALLFDVKNRVADLVPYLGDLTAAAGAGSPVPAPSHDAQVLFRGLRHKFAVRDSADCTQGAWIFTRVKQEVCSLYAAFDALDASRVHFAAVSNRKRECILLVRPGVNREHILKTLRAVEIPDRVTFRRE